MTDISIEINKDIYPNLSKYSEPIKPMTRQLIGRDQLIRSIAAAFERPELCNICLLAPAGAGKTALIQGVSEKDKKRLYLEIDLARMIVDCSGDSNQMGSYLKMLFAETETYVKSTGQEIVLFIDEFHQIVQISAAAVEALKPLLADSGTRGIRVAAATTLEEFNEFVLPNLALVERLQRINVPETDEATTVQILKDMAATYGVAAYFYNESLYHKIYEYTQRYIPASSQPRKSLKILDAMVGWHRAEGRKLDASLLADVIQESEDVNVAFRVDGRTIKKRLDDHVFAQEWASAVIEQRLQLCTADLNDKTKPMSTFLFCGPTGVGKTEMAKALSKILFDSERRLLRFDMTEFANSDSLEMFQNLLTQRIWEHPYSILLLDEVEKASPNITRLLLQVLDDGRLTDRNNREVSFTNAYIIMTTNAGSEIFQTIAQYNPNDEGSRAIVKEYDKLIRSSLTETTSGGFPPELLGRIDSIVPFQPLSRKTMERIVENHLVELQKRVYEEHGITIKYQLNNVVRYLIEENMDTDPNSGGARRVISTLESELTTVVARCINENPDCKIISVVQEGIMAADHKDRLESKAWIKAIPQRHYGGTRQRGRLI